MAAAVGNERAPGRRARAARERREQADCKRGQPRRNETQHVIHCRGTPAEVRVRRFDVADHRIERARCFERERERNPARRKRAERGDDAVAHAFRERLDRGARDLGVAEVFRIAPDGAREPLPRQFEVVARERGEHRIGLDEQVACREGTRGEHGFEHCKRARSERVPGGGEQRSRA